MERRKREGLGRWEFRFGFGVGDEVRREEGGFRVFFLGCIMFG